MSGQCGTGPYIYTGQGRRGGPEGCCRGGGGPGGRGGKEV